ncbi:polysaccharide pyruvyl transferase family protein [Aminobacter aminovorans]|uniref:polysaccharide pyruvyl transferase family protein n=1 Tax=Aminobacter aminovorans TaxID=83263 RepID=UPI002864E3E8|nr:polysaccharide pyruvyl transferase family protein [Aminobacter aminovorans]MDR7225390.1 hypothetical protein [Aminobacter aminovorans]
MSKAPVKLYWDGALVRPNFGDTLSPKLVEMLSGRDVVYASISRCDMVSIGSILDDVIAGHRKRLAKLRLNRIVVWGSGSFGTDRTVGWRWLDIRSVRGPKTRDMLGLAKEAPMGDPALLLDRVTPSTAKARRWGVIVHPEDGDYAMVRTMLNETPNSMAINLGTEDVIGTAREIASCDFIMSSSLHGLIAADALGVPSVWMHLRDIGGHWKFYDYFASVGRVERAPVLTAADLRNFENQADIADQSMLAQRRRDLDTSFASLNL